MHVVTHPPVALAPAYDLIGLSSAEMKLIRIALGMTGAIEDTRAGLTEDEAWKLFMQIRDAIGR